MFSNVVSSRLVPPNADPSTYIITLPTNNPNIGSVAFVDTAIYHWPQFDVNVSSRTGVLPLSTGGFTVADGPILFGKADEMNKNLKQVGKAHFRDEQSMATKVPVRT
jgi:hypothetical protein